MLYQYKENVTGGSLFLSTSFADDRRDLEKQPNLIHIHWNKSGKPVDLIIDGIPVTLAPNQLTTSTFIQHVEFKKPAPAITSFSFNREFYCINDHDHEVSCNGLIFFGITSPPVVSLSEEELRKFELLYDVFLDEYTTRDRKQGEMLRILLKRLIIKITRLVKEQLLLNDISDSQVDTIRKFNLLVEEHFKEKRQVNDYAEMLYKSPKTLSNLFARYKQKSPLQIIHERLILEAKRQLIFTDKTSKEIAFDLGFSSPGTFHKLFKKITSATPIQFRERLSQMPKN